MQPVPPKIDTPKSFIGVGEREIIIGALALPLIIFIVLLPLPTFLKVGLGVLIASLAVWFAIARHPLSGSTYEQHLLDLYRFHKRERFLQRGAEDASGEYPELMDTFFEDKRLDESKPLKDSKALFHIRPVPIGWPGFFKAASIGFLAGLLAWIWTGGLQEFLLRFGIY